MRDSLSHFDTTALAIESPLSEYKATSPLIAEFRRIGISLAFPQDETLFRQGDTPGGVYLVLGGEVELTMPVSRTRGMGFRATAGSLVGLPAAFSNQPYSMTAIALRGAELGHIDRQQLGEMLGETPILALDVLRILAAETRSARIAIVDVSWRHRSRGLPRRTLRAS
jgi:CRP-like cAMP-binding protein